MPQNYLIFLYKQYSQFCGKSSILDICVRACYHKYMRPTGKYVLVFSEILLQRVQKTVTVNESIF